LQTDRETAADIIRQGHLCLITLDLEMYVKVTVNGTIG